MIPFEAEMELKPLYDSLANSWQYRSPHTLSLPKVFVSPLLAGDAP